LKKLENARMLFEEIPPRTLAEFKGEYLRYVKA
jgi:hypothetical protein